MAIQQPIATDTLNAPDHSLSHRVIANDDSAPVQSVTVDSSGRTKLSYGRIGNVVVVTDAYNVLVTDEMIVCNKATIMTVSLPTATTIGQKFIIKNIGNGIVTLDGFGTDTIDNELTVALNKSDSISIMCIANSTWVII